MASMYIARLGRFVFDQMKTDVYTHTNTQIIFIPAGKPHVSSRVNSEQRGKLQ